MEQTERDRTGTRQARQHHLVGEPAQVGNVLRAAEARGDLVAVGELRWVGADRVAVDVTILQRSAARRAVRRGLRGRSRRVVLGVAVVGVVATAGGAALLIVLAAEWVAANAALVVGATAVAGVLGRRLVVWGVVRGVRLLPQLLRAGETSVRDAEIGRIGS